MVNLLPGEAATAILGGFFFLAEFTKVTTLTDVARRAAFASVARSSSVVVGPGASSQRSFGVACKLRTGKSSPE